MLMKNILAAFAIAGLVAAAPAEDIEARAMCGSPTKAWCCDTALSPVNIFFIRGIGKGCKKATNTGTTTSPNYQCPGKKFLCCANGQIVVSFSRLLPSAEGKVANRK